MRPRLFLVALALLLTSCSSSNSPGYPPGTGVAPQPVRVIRADLSSVVAVTGVIQATPQYLLLAAADGQLRQANIQPGAGVTAGQSVAYQAGQGLTAPVDGFFERWLVPDGATVHARIPVAVLRYGGFGMAADVPSALAYRMYAGPMSARMQVIGGPGPSVCQVLPSAAALTVPAPSGTDGQAGTPLPVLCVAAAGSTVSAGLSGTLGLTTAERQGVLVLPALAVAGAAGTGLVSKVVNGTAEVTEVKLGITDGVKIEIISGLSEGDLVLPFAPDIRPGIR